MATYYRLDQFHKNNTGNLIGFFQTKTEALKQVRGMQWVTLLEADETEHMEITPFEGETCDIDGWNEGTPLQPMYFI